MKRNPGILLVDDDISAILVLQETLFDISPDVAVTFSGSEALALCERRAFDLVVSDMRMPGMDGAQLLQQLSTLYPSMRRIIITGYADLDQTLKSINEGRVHQYLTKPWERDKVIAAVKKELSIRQSERDEVLRLRRIIDQLTDKDGD